MFLAEEKSSHQIRSEIWINPLVRAMNIFYKILWEFIQQLMNQSDKRTKYTKLSITTADGVANKSKTSTRSDFRQQSMIPLIHFKVF